MASVVELIKDLLIFIVAMFALFIVLLVVVARMPDDNPLKRILHALSYRLGATAAMSMMAIPIEPIPGLDALYDIGAPMFLIYYWFTLLREAVSVVRQGSQPARSRKPFNFHPAPRPRVPGAGN
jgi:hypothetical protein